VTSVYGRDDDRVRLLSAAPGPAARLVVDTDAGNEIDDQFALVHTLLAPDLAQLEAIYAAPFANARAATPAEGTRRSEAEIHRVLSLFPDRKVPVFAGSERWLTEAGGPVPSPAADDLIERSHAGS
jgi:purine nucleosidase